MHTKEPKDLTMNITYKLTLNEYQEAVNHHYKTGKRPLLVAVFLGMATFMLLVGTDFSNSYAVIKNIFIVFFVLSFYILINRILTAYRAKKIYNNSPILSNEVTMRISGKGLQHNKKNNNKTIGWEHFSKWKENEKYYLIYSNPQQFNVLPKRALNQAQETELNAYLEKYLSQNIK
jgi:hypothetical protein